MTTEKTRPEIPPGAAEDADAAATGNIRRGPLLGLVTLIAIGLFFGPNARKGPRSERVANPEGKVHYRRNLHNPTLFGDRHHADRVAGPDHELVAVRGLQPRAVASAGGLAAVSSRRPSGRPVEELGEVSNRCAAPE
ncbi:Uncharacterised protein [Mycolicibacterium thermoresistibile]|uniref:Putative membrane protein n=1 Tax=Mycolicibacterium thermoresistibile TaxID=1797 RepID=A0A100XEK6_MYCTH|nr:putative membrane protein [Mycolicibacterium thermoresistibile]SNW18347.1 Uncharacterised protein [Mycolicibacterium thermoresistibile]